MLIYFPYSERLASMDLRTLERRRIRGDILKIFKIFKGREEVELCRPPEYKTDAITRGHHLRYSREICSNEFRQNFLLNRSANIWNVLPDNVVNSNTMNEFKANLDRFLNDFWK